MAIYSTTVTVVGSSPAITLTITFEAIDANVDNFITFNELVPASTFTLAWNNPSILNPPSFTVSSVLEDFVFDEPYFLFDIVTNKFGSGLSAGLYVEFFGIQTNPGFWFLHDDGDGTGGCVVTYPCLQTSFDDVTIKFPVSYGQVLSLDLSSFSIPISFSELGFTQNTVLALFSIPISFSDINIDIFTLQPLKVTNIATLPYLDIILSTRRIG